MQARNRQIKCYENRRVNKKSEFKFNQNLNISKKFISLKF